MSDWFPRIALLGAGRTGCSLHNKLHEKNYELPVLWSRSEATAAAARAEGFPATTGALPVELGRAEPLEFGARHRIFGQRVEPRDVPGARRDGERPRHLPPVA